MASKREKAPHVEVILTPKGLRGLTLYDAEQLAMSAPGKTFQLVPMSKRSNKQLRTYWKALGVVVKATDKWASPENLSRDLKVKLGYYTPTVNAFTGQMGFDTDSIALNQMSPEEFRTFMDRAMAAITEAVGFDPMAFLDEDQQAGADQTRVSRQADVGRPASANNRG